MCCSGHDFPETCGVLITDRPPLPDDETIVGNSYYFVSFFVHMLCAETMEMKLAENTAFADQGPYAEYGIMGTRSYIL